MKFSQGSNGRAEGERRDWEIDASGSTQTAEQTAHRLTVLLLPDLLGFLELFDFLRGEPAELGRVHRREAFQFAGVKPDAFEFKAPVNPYVARVLNLHEATAVGQTSWLSDSSPTYVVRSLF